MKHHFTRSTLTLLFLFTLTQGLSQQEFNSTLLMDKAIQTRYSTKHDGANSDIYVQYLYLDGSNGVQAPLADSSSLTQGLNYTIMMWLKPEEQTNSSLAWNEQVAYAFSIPGSFSCYFDQSQTLVCESTQVCEKLAVSTSGIEANGWVHLSVSGSQTQGSYLQLESRTQVLSYDKKTYVIMIQEATGWKACLGLCGSSFGFTGGIRDFIFIEKYLTPAQTIIFKNNYLTWDLQILAYYRFTEIAGKQDEFRNQKASVIGKGTLQKRDYISNDICYPFLIFDSYLYFNQDNVIANQTIGSRWTPNNTNYSYTMSVWIKPSINNCYQPKFNLAITSCKVILLEDVFMMFFDSPSSTRFHFYALENYYEITTASIIVPLTQWINIQLAFNQYSGYVIQTYDQQGRLMQTLKQSYNMQQQAPYKKLFYLFTNFRGYARSFILMSKYIPLPYTPQISDYISDPNYVFYFKFLQSYNNERGLVSQGDDKGVTQDLVFTNSSSVVYGYQLFYDSVFSGTSTNGLLSGTTQLFDGIACDDMSFNLQMIDKTSYVKGQSLKTKSYLNGSTVEFWVKPYAYADINYIFSLYSNKYSQEFFSIFVNEEEDLICAPFGIITYTSPYIVYDQVTDETIQSDRWFHMTCSYSLQDTVIGYLKTMEDIDETYSVSISGNPSYFPSDNFDIYIGNSVWGTNDLKQGSPNMMFKDLRLWGYQRTQQEIIDWRFRQLNPFAYGEQTLLAYYRMAEASFHEFNYESIANSSAQAYATIFNIQYSVDKEVIVCPQLTYYYEGLCYNSPFSFLLPTIFPIIEAEQVVSWNFTLRQSSMFNTSLLFSELLATWSISDSVLMNVSSSQSASVDMLIASEAFAEQKEYIVGVEVTNDQTTFAEYEELVFVPVNCQWVIIEDSGDAYSTYNSFQHPQSTQDITWTIQAQKSPNGCETYYDLFIPNVTYYFSTSSPLTLGIPTLNITQIDADTLAVTLPRTEQFKLPTQEDISIVFYVYWTSSTYESMMDTTTYTFQNVLYSLNFAYQQLTVVPILTVNYPYALFGDDITLNASQTYITVLSAPEKYENMNFEWACPQSLSALCDGDSTSLLDISFNDFLVAGGSFNQTYTFQVQISWNDTDGVEQLFYAIQALEWYNITDPSFELSYSSPLLSTGFNYFELSFDNYDSSNISNLDLTWSIVPNMTVTTSSYFNISDDLTSLTIGPGGFKPNTKYVISVSATDSFYPIATRTQTVTFTTEYPPYGGTATLQPYQGYYNYTNFTINIQGWSSGFPPIVYQVWQASGPLGSTPAYLLSGSTWLDSSQTFTFKASSSNPFIVIISDQSQEVAYYKVYAAMSNYTGNITASSSGNSNSSTTWSNSTQTLLIQNILSSQKNLPQKYAYMNQLSSLQSTDSSQFLLEQINQDTSSVNSQAYIQNGNSLYILSNSVPILEQVLSNQDLTLDQANQSLTITSQISSSALFSNLINKNGAFLQSYANSLSSIVKSQCSTGLRRRRLNTLGAVELIQNSQDQIKNLANQMCYLLDSIQPQFNLITDTFNLVLAQLNTYPQQVSTSLKYKNEDKTFVTINTQSLLTEINQISNIDASSLCAQALYFSVNPYFSNNLAQYSLSTLRLDIVDANLISLQGFIDLQIYASMEFQIYPTSFKNNQTQCNSIDLDESLITWSASQCSTIINEENQSIKCYCLMSQDSYYTLITDSSRIQAQNLYPNISSQTSIQVTSPIDIVQSHAEPINLNQGMAFLSFIFTLICIATLIPFIASLLDKRDTKYCQQKLENGQKKQLLEKVAQLSLEPISYWIYKQDQLLAYNIQSISLFHHMLHQMHPLLSIFTRFDFMESRIIRFGLFQLQLTSFALVCILSFGPYYRHNDKSLDQVEIKVIIGLGVFGMVWLLNWPIQMNKCSKTKVSLGQDKSVVNQNTSNKSSSHHRGLAYVPEITQEQNIYSISPALTNIDKISAPIPIDSPKASLEQLDVIFRPKCKASQYLFLLFSYILLIIDISLLTTFSLKNQNYASNQYCIATSFYLGLMGSIFGSNVIRIIIQVMLVRKYETKKNQRCLRHLVSPDALRVMQEIKYVREADKALYSGSATNKSEYNFDKYLNEGLSQKRLQFTHTEPNDFDNIEGILDRVEIQRGTNEYEPNKQDNDHQCSFNSKALSKGVMPSQHNNDENKMRQSVLERVKNSLEKRERKKESKYSQVIENEQYPSQRAD